MTPEDWTVLDELAKAFADKGVKATPSQVASAIIHRHVPQIRDGREDVADLKIEGPDHYYEPGNKAKEMLKYIELKTGHSNNGPAWVARVTASKSGRTVYFDGKALKRAHLPAANHYDLANPTQTYWVSGIKKDGLDRHWAGSGKVRIEARVVQEYLRVTGSTELDSTRFEVIEDLRPTDPSVFVEIENAVLRAATGRRTRG